VKSDGKNTQHTIYFEVPKQHTFGRRVESMAYTLWACCGLWGVGYKNWAGGGAPPPPPPPRARNGRHRTGTGTGTADEFTLKMTQL
jgi:hypothetical protein